MRRSRCDVNRETCGLERTLTIVISITSLLQPSLGQLSLVQQNSALNPLQGQSTAPEGLYKDVQVYVMLSRLLDIDDESYAFKVNFFWGLIWADNRTEELIISNTLDPDHQCEAWCSTEQGYDSLLPRAVDILNNTDAQHTPLCCDGVYVPGAVAQNAISYDVSALPVQYQLSLLENGLISYRVQVQGNFYTNYNFKSYPFDRHELTVNIQTQFIPHMADTGTGNAANFYVVYAQNFGDALERDRTRPPISVDIYNSAQLSQGQAWQIDRLELLMLNDTYGISAAKETPKLSNIKNYSINRNGVRFIIHISRTSKGFYALMIIVPISLIVIFSFVIFVLPVTQIKGRLNIMATLFLTLIVLQFVLESIMPTAYTLIPPYYLLLVSYVYIFVMVGLAVFTNSLALQWQRRSARVGRKKAKNTFWKWIRDLPPPPPGSKLKFGQLPACHQHHNPITDGRHALARMLTRRFNSSKKIAANLNHEVATNRSKGMHITPAASFNGGRIDCNPITEHGFPDAKPAFHRTSGSSDNSEPDDQRELQDQAEEQPQRDRVKKSRPWTMKDRSSLSAFLLNSERVRWWSMWYYFIGLPVLLISYIAVVAIIFGVAQMSTNWHINEPVG